MEYSELRKELEEIKKILENMGNCYSIELQDSTCNLELQKKDISTIKSQGRIMGTTMRMYQRDIDFEKTLLEQHIEIEKAMKIRKLESDIKMEVLLTKLELQKKGLI